MAGNCNRTGRPEAIALSREAKDPARTGTVLNNLNVPGRTPGEIDRMLRPLQSWDRN